MFDSLDTVRVLPKTGVLAAPDSPLNGPETATDDGRTFAVMNETPNTDQGSGGAERDPVDGVTERVAATGQRHTGFTPARTGYGPVADDMANLYGATHTAEWGLIKSPYYMYRDLDLSFGGFYAALIDPSTPLADRETVHAVLASRAKGDGPTSGRLFTHCLAVVALMVAFVPVIGFLSAAASLTTAVTFVLWFVWMGLATAIVYIVMQPSAESQRLPEHLRDRVVTERARLRSKGAHKDGRGHLVEPQMPLLDDLIRFADWETELAGERPAEVAAEWKRLWVKHRPGQASGHP